MKTIMINKVAISIFNYDGFSVVSLENISELYGKESHEVLKIFETNQSHFVEYYDYVIYDMGSYKEGGKDWYFFTTSGCLKLINYLFPGRQNAIITKTAELFRLLMSEKVIKRRRAVGF